MFGICCVSEFGGPHSSRTVQKLPVLSPTIPPPPSRTPHGAGIRNILGLGATSSPLMLAGKQACPTHGAQLCPVRPRARGFTALGWQRGGPSPSASLTLPPAFPGVTGWDFQVPLPWDTRVLPEYPRRPGLGPSATSRRSQRPGPWGLRARFFHPTGMLNINRLRSKIRDRRRQAWQGAQVPGQAAAR